MFENIVSLDTQLMLALNGWHTPFFDSLMCFFSAKWVWMPLYASIIVVAALKYGFKQRLLGMLLLFFLAFAATDFLSSSVLRPIFCRPRPAQPDSPIASLIYIVNGYRGGHYGFPSSHAANTFMLSALATLFFRNRLLSCFLYFWAIAVSYSRIYLGVHYPGDILAGAFLGTIIAFGAYNIYSVVYKDKRQPNFKYIDCISLTGAVLFVLMLVVSAFHDVAQTLLAWVD